MTRTDAPFPVAAMLARLRIQATERCRAGTTPQSLGLAFLLNPAHAYEFMREYLFVMTGRQHPFFADLDGPLAVIDNMPVYCIAASAVAAAIVDPRVVPTPTDTDRQVVRGIWGALARGNA